MKVAYTEMKDACLAELRSKEYDLIVFAVIFISMLLVVIFWLFLFSLTKLGQKIIWEKKYFMKKNGNVCGNVPKICKRFKSGDPLGR